MRVAGDVVGGRGGVRGQLGVESVQGKGGDSRWTGSNMEGPKCYNTVMVIRVGGQGGGRERLRHDEYDSDLLRKGSGVRCPDRLRPWLIARAGHDDGDVDEVGGSGGTTVARRRRRRRRHRLGVDGRWRAARGESEKRLNYYELEISQVHYQVYPTSGTITVTGIPSPDCVPLMLDSLCSTVGLRPSDIVRCEPVNATYSGQLTPLQCGVVLPHHLPEDGYLPYQLETFCRAEGLSCSFRTSQFSGVHIRANNVEEIRGCATIFKSGKYNILGVRSWWEAVDWYRRICALIHRCWTTTAVGTPCAWTAGSCWNSPVSAGSSAAPGFTGDVTTV